MRDISSWSKKLRQALRESEDLKNYVFNSLENANPKNREQEVSRLALLITEVELGLTLLREIDSENPAKSVSALLLGYRFPIPSLQDNEKWVIVQKARFYLVRRKGRQWNPSLSLYMNLPETLRIFRLTNPEEIPQLIPSSVYPRRLQLYSKTLSKTPPHKPQKIELATAGNWYAKISHQGHTVEIPISIPEEVSNLAPAPQVSFLSLRTAENPPQTVSLKRLLEAAQEMDERLENQGESPENYCARLSGIALRLYDENLDDFQPGNEIQIDQFVHAVGLLNVGKSTLLEVLIYYLAKRGYRCALLVNDVVTQVRLASLFTHQLDIPSAPILGRDRTEHLNKVYESLFANKGEDITQGGTHPAWRWFSFICPLLGLVQAEEKWEFGQEPCHDLYQKIPVSNRPEAEEYLEEEEDEDRYTCPLYYKCPRHQLEQDIARAKVWILTPASLIHTRVPRQIFPHKLTFAEAVYRECHFLFVDEADRVQVQFDNAFSPSQILVDSSGNSFLNKLGLNFANAIYNSDRNSMSREMLAAGKRAQDYAQIATDIVLPRLHNQPKLVEWLGTTPFTGRSLFSHIVRDLLDLHSEENNPQPPPKKLTRAQRSKARTQQIVQGLPTETEREHRKRLMQTFEGFLQHPLDRRRGGELSDIALTILRVDSEKEALAEVNEWLKRWLNLTGFSIKDEDKIEDFTRNLHFAILITILNDRLGFMVDHLNTLMRMRIVDLHDVNQTLVYRPPRDFLPVVLSSPVGNILGFQYKRDRQKVGGTLEYFRYVGVGRFLLLNFPTLFAVDDWDGPHTVLISGTSYAPGSPAYHIHKPPTLLLEPASNNSKAGDTGICESEFFFRPQQRSNGDYIALSGLPPAARKKAVDDLVKAISSRPGQALSFLDRLFQTLKEKQQTDPLNWGDRERLLLITNSYDEAELVESILKPLYHTEDIDGIKTLRRDNAPAHLSGIRRGKIRDLKDLQTQIVIAPLMALERGHNILNEQQKAAFGAAVFLSRPMPIPDDWQNTVVQLNNWALEKPEDFSLYEPILNRGEALTLANIENEFTRYAGAKMLELNCRAMSFKQLNSEERRVLCWTQLVSLWQIVGRLVRGGVPCIVHFVDSKFAPNSVESQLDTETSSLLVGILKELQNAIENGTQRPYEITLASSLYGAFFNALKNTKEFNHGL
jgi:hypothetical protein